MDVARTWARRLTYLGLIALVLCLGATALESYLPSGLLELTWGAAQKSAGARPAASPPPNAACKEALKTELVPAGEGTELHVADGGGKLRVAGVWPREVRLGGQLCLVVAGIASQAIQQKAAKAIEDQTAAVAAAQKQLDAATEDKKADLRKKLTVANVALSEAQNQPPPTAELSLFLNGRRSPLSLKVPAKSEPQLVTYEFGQTADANSDDTKFWRNLLGSRTQRGLMPLSVGVSKSQSSGPEAEYEPLAQFRVYWPSIVGLGALSMVLLFTAFSIFATKSTILRDSSLTNSDVVKRAELAATAARDAAGDPPNQELIEASQRAEKESKEFKAKPGADAAGTFSLGRTQMALWLGLSTAGFIFIWLTLGLYQNVVTEAILVLLGINGLTGLAAVALDKDDPDKPAPKEKTAGFWSDLSSDGEGAKLQRIQMIVWTGILAVIFIWNVVANFVFVQFDAYLLLLMGIVNSTYLGFKSFEKKPAPAK